MTTVLPQIGLRRFLFSPRTHKAMFHIENAGLLSKSVVFALQTYASVVVGGLQGGHGRPNLWCPLYTLCATPSPPCPVSTLLQGQGPIIVKDRSPGSGASLKMLTALTRFFFQSQFSGQCSLILC